MTYKMSFKAISLYRIRIVLISAVTSFIIGAFAVFFPFIALTTALICGVVLILAFLVYSPQLYRNFKTEFSDGYIFVTKGVILKRKYFAPINHITYTGKIITPLQKFLGIFTICIYTRSGRIYIPNLENIPDFFIGKGLFNE